jgi:hypothetical protein
LTLDQWNAVIDVNIRGVMHGVAAAFRRISGLGGHAPRGGSRASPPVSLQRVSVQFTQRQRAAHGIRLEGCLPATTAAVASHTGRSTGGGPMEGCTLKNT